MCSGVGHPYVPPRVAGGGGQLLLLNLARTICTVHTALTARLLQVIHDS